MRSPQYARSPLTRPSAPAAEGHHPRLAPRGRPARLRSGALLLLLPAAAACAGGTATPAPAPAGGAVSAERGTGFAGSDRTLGIPPFAVADPDGQFAPLGYALADLLTTDLARASQLQLVERSRLGEILRELDLAASGRVDSASAPRVGRLVQARTLVLGGVSGTGRGDDASLRLAVRLADVRSGTVEQAVDASAPVADILAAEKALAFRIIEELGVTLTPAERAAIERRPTQDLAALLAYGRGVQQEYLGNFRGAAEEFRRAQRIDPTFQAAGVRALEARSLGEVGTATPVVVPGLRAVDAAVGSGLDVLNRPLVPVPGPARVTDPTTPGFPSTIATVIITVRRP